MEGWVDLGGWLLTEMVCPPTDGHPSKYTNVAAQAGSRTYNLLIISPTPDRYTTKPPRRSRLIWLCLKLVLVASSLLSLRVIGLHVMLWWYSTLMDMRPLCSMLKPPIRRRVRYMSPLMWTRCAITQQHETRKPCYRKDDREMRHNI